MRLRSLLADHPEFARILRFGLTGGCAFVAYSAAMLAVVQGAGGNQVAGAFAGFTVGTIVSYVGNVYLVFRVAPSGRNAVKFWGVTLAGLGLNLAMAFALERLGSPPLLTPLVIFAIVPVFNYIGHRLWTFRGALGVGAAREP